MADFKTFDEWKLACDAAHLHGPVQLGGFQRFAYTDDEGNAVAHWHSDTDKGTLPDDAKGSADIPDARIPNPNAGYQTPVTAISTEKEQSPDGSIPAHNDVPAGRAYPLTSADPQAGTAPKEENRLNDLPEGERNQNERKREF